MAEPVTSDAVRYYGYWTPWLIAAGVFAVTVLVGMGFGLKLLMEIRDK